MPTTVGIFDPTAFAGPRNRSLVNAIPLKDDILLAIDHEAHRSAEIYAIEKFLIARVTGKGFTISVQQREISTPITDPVENPFIHNAWEKVIQGMLVHGQRYSFAAVSYRKILPAASAVRQRGGLARTNNDSSEDQSDDDDGHGEAASSREDEEGEEDGPDVLRIPRLMDPVDEYFVRFLIGEDGQRVYLAFPRKTPLSLAKPIPHSRVFIFQDPEADGAINSPFQRCLEDFQKLRGYWERDEIRDWRNTNPPYIYEVTPKNDSLIPNETTAISSVVAEYDQLSKPGVEQVPKDTLRARTEAADKIKSSEYYLQILRQGNDHTHNAILTSTADQSTVDPKRNELHYNTQLGRWTTIDPIDTFNPFITLPQHVGLASNVPRPQPGPHFEYAIAYHLRKISNCTGVPADLLIGDRARVVADVQFSQTHLDNTVKALQRQLERMVAQMYIDIYGPLHRAHIGRAVAERTRRRRTAQDEAAARERKRTQLEAEIAALAKLEEETEESNAKARLKSQRADLQARLAEIQEPNPVLSKPRESQANAYAETSALELEQFMDERLQLQLEKELRIVVKFNENPVMTLDSIRALQSMGAITAETARRLSLQLTGLSEELLATDEQLDKEAKALAKRQKILTPEPAQPSSAGSASSSTSKEGASAAPSQTK